MNPTHERFDALFETAPLILLRGPNGSGKSTLLHTYAHQKSERHYIGHTNGLKPYLTVYETLAFWAHVLQGHFSLKGFESLAQQSVESLSFGQQRRLSLARLHLAWRPLWILDEPDTGLDDNAFVHLRQQIINYLDSGGNVLIASHNNPNVWPQPHVVLTL